MLQGYVGVPLEPWYTDARRQFFLGGAFKHHFRRELLGRAVQLGI